MSLLCYVSFSCTKILAVLTAARGEGRGGGSERAGIVYVPPFFFLSVFGF